MTDTSQSRRRFAALVPPPPRAIAFDWAATEAALGITLPGDYKWLIDTYGAGRFGGEILVWAPDPGAWSEDAPTPDEVIGGEGSRVARSELVDCRGELARSTWRNPDGTRTPIDVGGDASDMPYIPWGNNLDGMYGYWHTTTSEPDDWSIMFANFRTDQYLHHPGPLTECLHDIITARFAPDEFGSLDPVFSPTIRRQWRQVSFEPD